MNQYQTRVVTKGQILKWWLDELPEEDRLSIKTDATILVGEMWERNRHAEHKVHFGGTMAYELLYAIGRYLNEHP